MLKKLAAPVLIAGSFFITACGDDSSKEKLDTQAPAESVIGPCSSDATIESPGLTKDQIDTVNHLLHFAIENTAQDSVVAYTEQVLVEGAPIVEPGKYEKPLDYDQTQIGDLLCADSTGNVHWIQGTDALTAFTVAALQEHHINNQCKLKAEELSGNGINVQPDCAQV